MHPDQAQVQQAVYKHRQSTYYFLPNLRVCSEADAVAFVEKRRFVFFWPISGVPLPSLWGAAAGDRPVPNNHDDPGHITWRWKDNLLGQKKWYYTKLLRKKSTIISLGFIENFFALSDSAFHTIEDLEYLHRIGKRTRVELEIFSLLLMSGALDAITIREKIKSTLAYSTADFNRAMERLQTGLNIVPMGISQTGRWHYAYIYDVVERLYPEILAHAYNISKSIAHEKILSAYFQSNGSALFSDIKKLFQWEKSDIYDTVNLLQEKGVILAYPPAQDSFFVLARLV